METDKDIGLEGRLIVAACDKTGGIGYKGQLPWPHLRGDMKHFQTITGSHPVLMGRLTFESLPKKVRPLPGRLNIVLSRKSRIELGLPDEVLLANSLDSAAELLKAKEHRVVYVIGGEGVFKEAMIQSKWSRRVYLTYVHQEFECDRFFPIESVDNMFDVVSVSNGHEDNGVKYTIREFVRSNDGVKCGKVENEMTDGNGCSNNKKSDSLKINQHEEYQYLNLVRRILGEGIQRGDRTGTGTLSIFGAQMRFSLRDNIFPLLTTKKVFWRGVVEELLWFIKGQTNANILSSKKVRIWEANGSREALDNLGFSERSVGDLGPVYGFQWRHFGAKYQNMNTDYTGQGVDQLQNVIKALKTNPTDRRMIMTAWNPSALHEMALPPCHLLAQFYVGDGELSCQMYQRSCDMGLGVPFNIASYALLTRLLADVTGLKPGEFIHTLGDAHVYNNHIDALKVQIEREPRFFPKLVFKKHRDKIEEFVFDDFDLQGYEPHDSVSMKMAL